MDTVKNRVKELREQKGISQEALGELLDVSRWTIIRIEQERYAPSVELALKLVQVFGTSGVEEIFWLAENKAAAQEEGGAKQ